MPRKKSKSVDDVSKRLNEIFEEVNETFPGGRSKRYIGGSVTKVKTVKVKKQPRYTIPDADIEDENGVLRHIRSTNGYPPEDLRMRGSSITPTKKPRKKRSDAGKKRKPSEWIEFVKAVQKKYGLTYKEAMSEASDLKKEGVDIHSLRNYCSS
jgi:hypothetical protein